MVGERSPTFRLPLSTVTITKLFLRCHACTPDGGGWVAEWELVFMQFTFKVHGVVVRVACVCMCVCVCVCVCVSELGWGGWG